MFARKWLVEGLGGLLLGAAAMGALSLESVRTLFASRPAFAGAAEDVEARGGDGDRSLPPHANEVASYTLRAVFDARAHVIHGEGTITWRNTSRTRVREIWLHLYLNAFKNERTLFLRAPLGARGRGSTKPSDFGHITLTKLTARGDGTNLAQLADKTSPGDPDDETDIRVPLAEDVEPGEALTLDVAWESKLPSIVERTGYADDFVMAGQWFPKIARLEEDGTWRHFPLHRLSEFYADFGNYDVTLDVPEGTVVGATGKLVSKKREKGREEHVYRQNDVHDFAWTAWPNFREETIAMGGVDVRILYPPGYEMAARHELDLTRFGLQYFGERFGRYPYSVLTIVHPPKQAEEAGGMEYPTLITTGGAWYVVPFTRDLETVTIHELAHQYFYGLVATDEERTPFLDEGLSTYVETEALTARFGEGATSDVFGYRIGRPAYLRWLDPRPSPAEAIVKPASSFAATWSYASLVYTRSALILETFARLYGHDTITRALGRYARRYRFAHPTFSDFLAVMREELGERATSELERALTDKGWVDYRAVDAISELVANTEGSRAGSSRSATEPSAPLAFAPTWQGFALVMRHGTLRLPVDVELTSTSGESQIVHWDGQEEWVRIPYRGTSPLAYVMVDPQARALLDADLLNNGFRLTPPASPIRSLERAAYFAEIGLHALLP